LSPIFLPDAGPDGAGGVGPGILSHTKYQLNGCSQVNSPINPDAEADGAGGVGLFKNNCLTEMCSGSETGSYVRLMFFCMADAGADGAGGVGPGIEPPRVHPAMAPPSHPKPLTSLTLNP